MFNSSEPLLNKPRAFEMDILVDRIENFELLGSPEPVGQE